MRLRALTIGLLGVVAVGCDGPVRVSGSAYTVIEGFQPVESIRCMKDPADLKNLRVLPGVQVTLHHSRREEHSVSDSQGRFTIETVTESARGMRLRTEKEGYAGLTKQLRLADLRCDDLIVIMKRRDQ